MDVETRIINFKPWIRLIDLYDKLGLNKTVYKRFVNQNLIDNVCVIEGLDFVETRYREDIYGKAISFHYGISTTLAKHFCFKDKSGKSREIIDWILELEKEYFIFS